MPAIYQDESFVSGDEPQGGMDAPKVFVNTAIFKSQNENTSILLAATATPSLTITNKTATSITYNVVFPTSGAKYNIISLYDFNQGESILPDTDHTGNIYRAKGTYTISGLVPGGMYQLCMVWLSPDGSYYGGDCTIYRRVLLPYNTPETLIRNEGTYVNSETYKQNKDTDIF